MKRSHAVLALFTVVFAAPCYAQWHVETRTDSMTDKLVKSAVLVNSEGHTLTIYRSEDKSIWAVFRLSSASLDVLASTPPIYRIDKLPPNDLGEAKRSKIFHMFEQEPKWVQWLIFHGDGPANTGTLRELMDGHTLIVRYFLFTGGNKETTFNITGAKDAISRATGIPSEADPNAATRDKRFHEVFAELSNKCQSLKGKASVDCALRLGKCAEKANGDPEAMRACMK